MSVQLAVTAAETPAANGHGEVHSTATFKALMLGGWRTRSFFLGVPAAHGRTLTPDELRAVHFALDDIHARELAEQVGKLLTASETGEGFQRGNNAVLEELGRNVGIIWGGRRGFGPGRRARWPGGAGL